MDDIYAEEGGEGWVQLMRDGVTLIASDRPLEAYKAIDAADGPGQAWAACL